MSEPKKQSKVLIHQAAPLPRVSIVIWIISVALLSLLAWAWWFELAEVSTGTGKVIPSSKEQVIQSLDGGILAELKVQEGDVVEKGQVLAKLDPTRSASNVGETASLLLAAQAKSARLQAELSQQPLNFSELVRSDAQLVAAETALYHSRRANLAESLAGLQQAHTLVKQELEMTAPLVEKGAASEVEVLRLKREMTNLQNQMADIKNRYIVSSREELARANSEVQAQHQIIKGKTDSLVRTTFNAPLRSIVKEIDVMTLGGVIPPNGKLMTLVPLDEKLIVEARISPRDIAFIHAGQSAMVKLTAYDYSIYGGLEGKVKTISPDTLRDEVKQDQFYYRVYIQTETDQITNKEGQKFGITPGMMVTVDIQTGKKTVLDYLLKPFNKAQEALRER